MSNQLTPWFDGSEKPKRKGVYERVFFDRLRFSRWDGKQWYVGRASAEEASQEEYPAILQDGCKWRGLAQKPPHPLKGCKVSVVL